MYNNSYYAVKNQLHEELIEKCEKHVKFVESNEVRVENDGGVTRTVRGPLYVNEWMHDNEHIYAIGCNLQGFTRKMRIAVKPGLFVVSGDVDLLRKMCFHMGYATKTFPGVRYDTNNFSVCDVLMNYGACRADGAVLTKILTGNVRNAFSMHRELKNHDGAYKYAAVPYYWDVEKQILFEMLIARHQRTGAVPVGKQIPAVVGVWIDEHLNVYKLDRPDVPIISFDIETVSSDPHRLLIFFAFAFF